MHLGRRGVLAVAGAWAEAAEPVLCSHGASPTKAPREASVERGQRLVRAKTRQGDAASSKSNTIPIFLKSLLILILLLISTLWITHPIFILGTV